MKDFAQSDRAAVRALSLDEIDNVSGGALAQDIADLANKVVKTASIIGATIGAIVTIMSIPKCD